MTITDLVYNGTENSDTWFQNGRKLVLGANGGSLFHELTQGYFAIIFSEATLL